jgi:hypothetical protein
MLSGIAILGQPTSRYCWFLLFFPLAKAEAITYRFEPWIEGSIINP